MAVGVVERMFVLRQRRLLGVCAYLYVTGVKMAAQEQQNMRLVGETEGRKRTIKRRGESPYLHRILGCRQR